MVTISDVLMEEDYEDITNVLFDVLEENEVDYMEPQDFIDYTVIETEPMPIEHYHEVPFMQNINNYEIPYGVTKREMKCIITRTLRDKKGTRPEKTKERMSIARTGTTMDEETRQKISESMKNRTLSENHRTNISLSMKGKNTQPKSEETKRKISETRKKQSCK